MTTKAKDRTAISNVIITQEKEGQSKERTMAELALSPVLANTVTVTKFKKGAFGDLDLTESIGVLQEKAKIANTGDFSEIEATLFAQAATLDAIFNEMARRAALNMGEHLHATETYMRLALKAQTQCRSTLETLAEVKYPKAATFVRQQNVAYQQQVNNGSAIHGNKDTNTHAPAHGKTSNQSNELLGPSHGKRLDN